MQTVRECVRGTHQSETPPSPLILLSKRRRSMEEWADLTNGLRIHEQHGTRLRIHEDGGAHVGRGTLMAPKL